MIKSYSGKRSESKRWIKHALDIHYMKLRKMRPTLEISRPQHFSHLNSRAKQEQQKEGNISSERFTEIERANRILLEKMSGILNTKSSLSVPFKKKSLNTEMRKKFLEKIADDNKSFLKRLQCRTPVYSIQQWEKEWRQTEKRLKNMSEFNYKSAPKSRAKSSTGRNVVFKKSLQISNRNFLVEILKKFDNIRIVLYDPQVSESYSLEIPYLEALELMGGSEDFESLISLFRIKNDEIMIVSGKENSEGLLA